MTPTFSWNERFSLIDYFMPTDAQICVAFSVTQDELDTARQLRSSGTFRSVPTMNCSQHAGIFNVDITKVPTPPPIRVVVPTSASPKHTVPVVVSEDERPLCASRPIKELQKRGRKGDKIAKAFMSVPTTPTPVQSFMAEHCVSLAVLRQSKRFIEAMDPVTASDIGKVIVKQDKTTKTLMIWREPK